MTATITLTSEQAHELMMTLFIRCEQLDKEATTHKAEAVRDIARRQHARCAELYNIVRDSVTTFVVYAQQDNRSKERESERFSTYTEALTHKNNLLRYCESARIEQATI